MNIYRSATLSHDRPIRWTVTEDGAMYHARATRWIEAMPRHKQIRRIMGTRDALAFRQLLLDMHGRPTLMNIIRADQGHPRID